MIQYVLNENMYKKKKKNWVIVGSYKISQSFLYEPKTQNNLIKDKINKKLKSKLTGDERSINLHFNKLNHIVLNGLPSFSMLNNRSRRGNRLKS